MLIEEAHENGARYSKACEVVGISLRTLQRWKSGCLNDQRKGSKKTVPRKVPQEIREEIVAVCNEQRFRDQTPYEIVPQLLTEGRYLASESTICRIYLFHGPVMTNPYIESLFKTMKYHVTYTKAFETLEDARQWMGEFVNWYNTEHRHSSIWYVTPHQMRYGQAKVIFEQRNRALQFAREIHPERWGSRPARV